MGKGYSIPKLLNITSLLLMALIMQGCLFGKGKGAMEGQLTGVPDRDRWKQEIPYGMITVPAGVFHMGQADEDIVSSRINMNRQITIGGFYMDDTEITNNEYRQFINESLANPDSTADGDVLTEDDIMERFYPDTTVWETDFTHHYGDPMVENYYAHPAYDDYPVVGVSWHAAQFFCDWRTKFWNEAREADGKFPMPKFRLASEAEWEYAARGGLAVSQYPWGGPYIRNDAGCFLANFKPLRGNYVDDGGFQTVNVYSYSPNDYGLYCMSGNVAEWTNNAYSESAYEFNHDMNSDYQYEAEDDEQPVYKRKVIRGGSWKDVSYYLGVGVRSYEYQDTAKCYIGFRNVMSYLGRAKGDEL